MHNVIAQLLFALSVFSLVLGYFDSQGMLP